MLEEAAHIHFRAHVPISECDMVRLKASHVYHVAGGSQSPSATKSCITQTLTESCMTDLATIVFTQAA